MRVIFLGAPGSGKGTQAKLLQAAMGIPQLSTGDLLRKAVRLKTAIGREAEQFMDAGELVPDDLVIALILERMKNKDCEKGFILDGFPRTLAQAQALEAALEKVKKPIRAVIDLRIDDKKMVERLVGRRICPKGHGEWHIKFHPPNHENECDVCGLDLIHREDDYEEQIVTRLEAYHRQTEPLSMFYQGRGILYPIKAEGDINEISEAIRAVVTSAVE